MMTTQTKMLAGLGGLLTAGVTVVLVLATQGTAAGSVVPTCPGNPATAAAACLVNTATGVDGANVDTSASGIDAALQGTDWTPADLAAAVPDDLSIDPGSDTTGILPGLTSGQTDSVQEVGAPAILPLNPDLAVPQASNYVRGASR